MNVNILLGAEGMYTSGRSSQASAPEVSSQGSACGSSSTDFVKCGSGTTETSSQRKSSLSLVMAKAKAKLSRRPSGAEALPDNEQEFERQKAKDLEKQKRKKEYERFGLDKTTKFGMSGAGGWKAG